MFIYIIAHTTHTKGDPGYISNLWGVFFNTGTGTHTTYQHPIFFTNFHKLFLSFLLYFFSFLYTK
nr:MAG TPA: hypothetical protein [Caudoviricetes sp.]